MKKYGIFYGSTTGTTQEVAEQIANQLRVDSADVHNVSDTAPSALGDYEVILAGSSTWGDGELQDSWYDFLDGMEGMELKGKKVAVFGCGDENHSDTFCNAVEILAKAFTKAGATLIAPFNTDGYDFENSSAVHDGQAVGLLIDNDNAPEKTPERITAWVAEVKKES